MCQLLPFSILLKQDKDYVFFERRINNSGVNSDA